MWLETITLPVSGTTLVPLPLKDRTVPKPPPLGFGFHFLRINKEEKQLDFFPRTSCLWEEAVVLRISGAAIDLLKSLSIIIWQQHTSSHTTHAFANWHPQNQSGTKLECLYFWVQADFFFFKTINHKRVFFTAILQQPRAVRRLCGDKPSQLC